jgi:large subunit ribosomal protein L10
MAKTKAQKQEIITKLENAFKNATSSVFVHFNGLAVSDESAIRRDFKKEGVRYFVAKKTLIMRALASLGHKVDDLVLDGEIAIAYGGEGDATAAARLVHAAGKKLADKVSIAGGLFEGKLVGMQEMREIALIPSLDALRGMFAQIINSPRSRFAIALSEVAKTKNA